MIGFLSGRVGVLLAGMLLLLLLLPVMLSVTAAQDPQTGQRPVFRAGTDFVRIDVYPRQRGRVVEGLTREDFQVFEDGAPQTIETFEFVPIETDVEPLDPRDAREARRMAADPRHRVFVFYLDIYYVTMEGSARAREPLLEFLRTGVGPRDLFAVMTPKQSPEFLEFGRATHEAAAYMTLSKPWGVMDSPVTDPFELELEACAPGRDGRPGPLVAAWRWASVMSDLEGLIAYLGALRPERKNLIIVSERWQSPLLPFRGLHGTGASPVAARFQGGIGGRARGSFELPKAVTDAAERCSKARQSVMGATSELRRRDLVDMAREANVALYFISPAPQSLFSAGNLAREMADRTDGLSLVSNDFYAGLERIVDHQTGYYMLGYRSTHGPAGERPRNIRVRTSRRGVELDVQRMYKPPTSEEMARAATATPSRARTDVERAFDALERIRDETELFVRAIREDGNLDLTVELSAPAYRSRWRDGADVAVVLRDAAGTEVARTDAGLAAGARSVRVRLPLPSGESPWRASVRFTRGTASASELADIDRGPQAALGFPFLFRAGSLPRQPFVPAADLRFDRVERLRLEWPVQEILTSPTVRVLNRKGEERPADVTVTEIDDGVRRLRADVRLLSLAPGDYVIEATARAGEQDVKQLIAVRIVR